MRALRGIPSLYLRTLSYESYNLMGVGAADKAAIQRVKVPPCQLLVSDT